MTALALALHAVGLVELPAPQPDPPLFHLEDGRLGNRMASDAARTLRKLLFAAQGGRCGICGQKMFGTKGSTLDHVWPRRHWRGNHGNQVIAHRLCNEVKADRDPTGCELIWLEVANAGLA